jgi:tRNA-(ms[2]io[6]A)-hydroxylase
VVAHSPRVTPASPPTAGALVLNLAAETEQGWAEAVGRHLPELLLDHAHCEKKAASTAINLVFKYQWIPALMAPLSAHAREELEHFELCLRALDERGWAFGPLEPSPYAARLFRAVRHGEPERLVDTLLVMSLIEARSCERMKLLAESLPDPALAGLYRSLLASEARHHTTFVDLAATIVGREAVKQRLPALAAHEAEVLAELPREARMHSRAPA